MFCVLRCAAPGSRRSPSPPGRWTLKTGRARRSWWRRGCAGAAPTAMPAWRSGRVVDSQVPRLGSCTSKLTGFSALCLHQIEQWQASECQPACHAPARAHGCACVTATVICTLSRLPDERMNRRSRSRTPAVSAAPSGDDGDSDAEAAAQHEPEQQRQGAELNYSHPQQQQQQQQQTSRLWQVTRPPSAPQVQMRMHICRICVRVPERGLL